jgi:hypothetical protein
MPAVRVLRCPCVSCSTCAALRLEPDCCDAGREPPRPLTASVLPRALWELDALMRETPRTRDGVAD